jgi:hypothetical protein
MIIFKISNVLTGEAFIGISHNDLETTRNLCACGQVATSNAMGAAFVEYGFDAFVWETLVEGATQADLKAQIAIHETDKDGYNVKPHRKASRKPASAKTKKPGRAKSPEHKKAIGEALRGKPKTDAHKLALSAGHATMKESGLFYQDPEYKAKISAANKGKKRTKAQTEKNRQAGYRRWYGNYKDVY